MISFIFLNHSFISGREKLHRTSTSYKVKTKATKLKQFKFKLNSTHKKKDRSKKNVRKVETNMVEIGPNETSNQETQPDQQEPSNVTQNDMNAESLQKTAKQLLGQTNSLIKQLMDFGKSLENIIGRDSNATINSNASLSVEFDSRTTSTSNDLIQRSEVNNLETNATQFTENDVLPLLNSPKGEISIDI